MYHMYQHLPQNVASNVLRRTALVDRCQLARQAAALPGVVESSMTKRHKHSSTQIKRLFKKNPSHIRVLTRRGDIKEPLPVPSPLFPAIFQPTFLPNGWSAPPGSETTVPSYPFHVSRTKNKPEQAIGFLPVYSEYRRDGARVTTRIKKVLGDREAFLTELRSVLQIPVARNPKDDIIWIRTGGTIEVKGNRVREVKTWLAGLGF